ncbi:MAG: DOMON domain-containing protein [Armatimonadota bacterium]
MKRTFFLVVLALAAVGLQAVELAKTPVEYLLLKPVKPIVIDGKLDEWDMARTPYTISPDGKNPANKVMSNDATNPVKGAADFSGRAALAWDDKYLYVAGQMTDDHLMGIRPDSFNNQGPAGWGCDSLMVQVASYRQPLKSNSPFSNIPFLGLRYAPMGANPRGGLVPNTSNLLDKRDLYWVLTEHSQWKVTETATGYNVEAAIPWADLEFTPAPGERLFISFLAADIDPDEALTQIGWSFTGDPKTQPMFRLADRADILGVITISQDEVPANAAWTVRTELAARTGTAKLTGLRIVDEKANVVFSTPLPMEVPAGMTGTDLREIKAGAVGKPGRYTVEALTGTGVIARVPVRIVAPTAEPPMIKNLPGEIHHMGPDRVAHNAVTEHREGFYKHNFVTKKDDYIPYIRRHVEPTLKSLAKGDIASKSRWGYSHALQCMSLYKITGDQEYAQLARDIMDYTLDAGDLGWFKVTSIMQYRYLSWLKDPASPFAPKDAEKRLRAFFHKVAAEPNKTMEDVYPGNGLFGEWGTHNRVWHRYMLLKIARLIAEQDGKPIDKRINEYTDYHDKLIGEVGDSDDASAGYHWVFFDAAIGIYFFTGDWDAFLKHKGYTKTLSRYVEMVGPNGACPPFASCSGWPEVGQSMWAYELMSSLSRDGRFRWSSQRIAEYYYNHLDDRANQYHGPYDTARNNFVLSYLFADDAVTPKPPTPQSRVTWRHPLVPVSLEKQKAHPGTWIMEMGSNSWIPDKVVLSSGNDAQSLWGLVELLPIAGHGGELPGNIIALGQQDAALFAGQGYYENTPEFQNILWIEDLDGLAADPRPMTTEVPIFIEDPAFTFVRIKTTAYQHLPVTYTRDILFYKNGFMVVKDRVKFDSTMKVRVGPCYYARNLGPESGANWFNAFYSQLYYTGLGLGRGVQAIRNPAWDLLVYFSPRADRKHSVIDRYMENPYRNSPVQLRQTWSGMVRAGQELTFTSVLLPHSPMINPSALLNPPTGSKDPKRIEVVQDDDNLTVVKVVYDLNADSRFPFETWVMLNDTGKIAKAGPLESDGLVSVIGLNYQGNILNRAVAGGNLLRFRNADQSAQARKPKLGPVVMPAEFGK